MNRIHLLSILLVIALLASTYRQFQLNQEVEQLQEQEVSKKDAILSVIHARKSVRKYIDKPVSKDDLTTILKAGMAAPSGMDKRPWKFIAITDTAIIHQLNQESPAAIVVCGDMEVADERAQEFWVTDTSLACGNMLLAIESMGLGAVWKSVYPWKDYTNQVRETLHLPNTLNPLCIITIGYPTGVEKAKEKYDVNNVRWQVWE